MEAGLFVKGQLTLSRQFQPIESTFMIDADFAFAGQDCIDRQDPAQSRRSSVQARQL